MATPAQRSWAQMVQGEADAQNVQKNLQPARRGSLLRFCRGEVLKMLGNYGWLMVYGNIDHPSVEKHGGDVYIHKDDVVEDESLTEGDVVTFYLYVDEKGLGAEQCQVEEKAGTRKGFNTKAIEFVPAYTKQSLPKGGPELKGCNPNAAEFVPSDVKQASPKGGLKLKAAAKEFVMPPTPKTGIEKLAACNDVLNRLSQVFYSDDEDEDVDISKPWQAKRAPSSDGSTYGGDTSDSDEEKSSEEASDSESETSPTSSTPPLYYFRPPPGLSLPPVHTPVFCLPPGLCPPGLEPVHTPVFCLPPGLCPPGLEPVAVC